MGSVLFANATPCDWVSHVLVPLLVSIVSAAATVGGGWWLLTRTEAYRRLARWEPYSERLWTQQVELYAKVCHAARDARVEGHQLVYNSERGNPEKNRPLQDAFDKKEGVLDAVDPHALILLSDDFVKVYSDFRHQLFMFVHTPREDPQSRERLANHGDAMNKLCKELIAAARRSMGAQELSERAIRSWKPDEETSASESAQAVSRDETKDAV